MFRIKQPTIEQIIVFLFAILPIVDSLNGILITKGLPSIGIVYKMFVLGLLFVFTLRKGSIPKSVILCSLLSILYILFCIGANVLILSGKLISTDYPIKLIFNILTFAMLINCIHAGYINGDSLYRILNINTWFIIIMILIPYVLGLGNTIYSSGLGYKAFFYSNNELSASLLVLFYFALFRLRKKLGIAEICQLLGVALCVLLLNTKSGIIACLVGGALFILEYMLHKESKCRGLVLLAICAGLYIAKDFIWEQVAGFLSRQDYLSRLYDGSFIDILLSGRTVFMKDAWHDMAQGSAFWFRFLFGNGFCSKHLVEMDFIDIFFYLGAFGVLLLTIFLCAVFIKSHKNFKTDGTLMRPCGFWMIVGFAFLAGHVFFMATAGCYFILVCCFNLTYSTQNCNIIQRRTEQL